MEKETKTKVWNGIKEGVHFVGAVAGTIIAVAGAAKVLRKVNDKNLFFLKGKN